jgi:hypothetical protein
MSNNFSMLMAAITLVASSAMALSPQDVTAQEATGQEVAPKPVREVVASSTLWREGAEEAKGSFHIVRTSIGTKVTEFKLILGSNFATDSGPDLKVVLSPLAADQVASKTALRHSFIVGELTSYKGASTYDLPLDTDLNKYKSVLIHCEKYTKLWASAPLSDGEVIASGNHWVKKAKSVRGSWEIAKVGKIMVLRLGEDFKTKSAADLRLVLSPNSAANASSDNALENAVMIGGLQKVKGAQQYQLPAGLDLKEYSSLLIHCKEYSKLWGGASITK